MLAHPPLRVDYHASDKYNHACVQHTYASVLYNELKEKFPANFNKLHRRRLPRLGDDVRCTVVCGKSAFTP